ncbi:hypothetical protein Nepgr_001316 [Nepenthes gracilis]|uniref:Protein YIP n=1 Tax=Nepenthes gracilis TaxID=150966 RepID=A0AAD3RW03_NEPGR|nr:hypothetical protein Nepgr_001316 [Nepenthes gracilis]
MTNEFNVPPVVFPAGGNPGPALHQRRTPTAPFPGTNHGIPFMSFDIGAAESATATPFSAPSFSERIGGGDSLNLDDEPPLLEELGINTKQIWSKTVSILNPFRVKSNSHEDADLSGPFLLLVAFGLFQLLAGKIHFGFILGWISVASIFLYVVFNMLAGRNGDLDLHRCFSLIGYSMLPMVILSALALFVPQGGAAIFAMACFFVVWSTRICSSLLVELASIGGENRWLISYACLLIYALFSLLIIF